MHFSLIRYALHCNAYITFKFQKAFNAYTQTHTLFKHIHCAARIQCSKIQTCSMFESYNFIFPVHFSLSLSLFCIVPLTRHLMHIPDMSINFYCLQAGLHRTSDDKNTRWFLNEFAFVIRQKVSSTHTERQRHNGCKKRPVNEHVMYFRKAAFKFPNFRNLKWCTELMW